MKCRVYDAECINARFCSRADACCAGDPKCKPVDRWHRRFLREAVWALLAIWFAALVLLALLAGCTRVVERRVVVRMDPVVVPCLVQKPPAPVAADASAAVKADAYDELERYVRLLVVPSCLEQR